MNVALELLGATVLFHTEEIIYCYNGQQFEFKDDEVSMAVSVF